MRLNDETSAARAGRSPAGAALTAVAVAAAVAVVNTCALALTSPLAALRETALVWLIRFAADARGIAILPHLPMILNREYALRQPLDAAVFAGLATLVNALVLVPIAIAAWAFLLVAGAGSPRLSRFAPTLLLVVLLAPALVFTVHRMDDPLSPLAAAGVGVFAALILALLSRAIAPAARARATKMVAMGGVALAAAGTLSAILWPGPPPAPRPAAAPGSPNVVLISIDSLRADHVGCFGAVNPTTPVIDALASEGVRFPQTIAPASWTLPSHVTLLTGLPPEAHGVNAPRMRLSGDATTLAEIFSAHGYATAGVASATYLDRRFGFAQGFDDYDDFSVLRASGSLERSRPTSTLTIDTALAWLRRWNGRRERPFFLFVHMWDPHLDYAPPPPYRAMFDPGYRGALHTAREEDPRIGPSMPRRELDHVRALYDGEIRYTDTEIGRVVSFLRDAGLLDDTVVVVTADHGDEFFEHGRFSHHKTLYDEVLRVPLVMRFPRALPRGTTVGAQVRLMDVAPTILSLAGIRHAPFVRSASEGLARDLTPVIRGTDSAPPPPAFGNLEGRIVSIRTPERKLIVDLEHATEALFDLRTDPGERRNLSPMTPHDDPLRVALRAWVDRWRHDRTLARDIGLSAEQESKLRALGYIK